MRPRSRPGPGRRVAASRPRRQPGAVRDERLPEHLATRASSSRTSLTEDWALRPRSPGMGTPGGPPCSSDRAKGFGRSKPEAVVAAWESCLGADPTCEEAASALMQVYAAQQRWSLVADTYERCRRALEELGLAISPAFEEIHAGVVRESSPTTLSSQKRPGALRPVRSESS